MDIRKEITKIILKDCAVIQCREENCELCFENRKKTIKELHNLFKKELKKVKDIALEYRLACPYINNIGLSSATTWHRGVEDRQEYLYNALLKEKGKDE